jgi:hypothetical protein
MRPQAAHQQRAVSAQISRLSGDELKGVVAWREPMAGTLKIIMERHGFSMADAGSRGIVATQQAVNRVGG